MWILEGWLFSAGPGPLSAPGVEVLLPALLSVHGWDAHILPCLSFSALKAGWREYFPPWQGPADVSKGCVSPWWDGACSGTEQGMGPILPSQPGWGNGVASTGGSRCGIGVARDPAPPGRWGGGAGIPQGLVRRHQPWLIPQSGETEARKGTRCGWGCQRSEQPPDPTPRAPEEL